MSAKGAIGWIILVVALAVPAFMFWNWWQAINQHKPEIRMKMSQSVFPGGSATVGMSNPAALPSSSVAPPRPAVPVVAAAAPSVRNPAGPADPPPMAMSASQGPGGPSAVPLSAAAAGNPASGAPAYPAQPGARPLVDGYSPKTDRDPTLSPNDIRRLAEAALQKRLAEEELERQARLAREAKKPVRMKKRALPSPDTLINVVGIISVERAAPTAILEDGRIIKQGDTVLGAMVLKITSAGVVFGYRNKTFTKTVRK